MSLFNKRSEASSLEELKEEWKNCQQCPFYAQRNQIVIGHGNPETAKIYVVGQAPAGDEDRTGIPFSGKGGQVCKDLFNQEGIPEKELFWSNVLCCRMFKDSRVRKAWMENCWERVESELRIVQPKAIVTLGRPAAERFVSNLPAKGETSRLKFMYEGIPGITATHPAVLLRKKGRDQKSWKAKIDKEFDLIRELYDKFCRT